MISVSYESNLSCFEENKTINDLEYIILNEKHRFCEVTNSEIDSRCSGSSIMITDMMLSSWPTRLKFEPYFFHRLGAKTEEKTVGELRGNVSAICMI